MCQISNKFILLLTNSLYYIADDVDTGDLDIERAIVRSELACDTRVPDPVGTVYDLNDDGSIPGIGIFCLGKFFKKEKFNKKEQHGMERLCVRIILVVLYSTYQH